MNLSFLEQLNDSQRKAVEYIDGASLVIAGAGSGKTRVLTYKIAYLLQSGYMPWNLLALTFTNKAAREMKDRIEKLVGPASSKGLYMGTFHSVFSRILRKECHHLDFLPNFTIYDESDSNSLIKLIIKEMALDEKVYKPASVHSVISMAKNHLVSAEMYAENKEALQRDKEMKMGAIYQIYLAYAARCKQANAMDFDDLLLYTYILFRDHEDVRKKYAERFRFVLVDEYQDTNVAQQRIVYQLTAEHQHVCVVGDDAQSIYAFRGANIDNILAFQQQYEGSRLFKLERNYRSTQRIVKAANSLIQHNKWQIKKDVYSNNDEGDKIIFCPVSTDKVEAITVCRIIRQLMRDEHAGYDDFAVLYRTNVQSKTFEEQMLKDSIPYRVYGGLSYYQRKEVKDIIAYFRVVTNPDDEEALRRIINYPTRGIGATTLNKISETASRNHVSLWSVVSNPAQYELQVSKRTITSINAFHDLISGFIIERDSADAYTLGKDIITVSGIARELLADNTPEGLSRKENLDEMLNSLLDFVQQAKEEDRSDEIFLTDYLQEVALYSDLDSDGDDESGRVSLMTIHSSKGLEFTTVFVVGLEENIFPSPRSVYSPRELEEERRLLYVAITRAEKHCYLTCARQRMRFGKSEFNPESRFLHDIDVKLLQQKRETFMDDAAPMRRSLHRWQNDTFDNNHFGKSNVRDVKLTPVSPVQHGGKTVSPSDSRIQRPNPVPSRTPSPSPASSSLPSIKVGDKVLHSRFGEGVVLKVEGTGENTKTTVQFSMAGTKQLLLKFARLKIVQ